MFASAPAARGLAAPTSAAWLRRAAPPTRRQRLVVSAKKEKDKKDKAKLTAEGGDDGVAPSPAAAAPAAAAEAGNGNVAKAGEASKSSPGKEFDPKRRRAPWRAACAPVALNALGATALRRVHSPLTRRAPATAQRARARVARECVPRSRRARTRDASADAARLRLLWLPSSLSASPHEGG